MTDDNKIQCPLCGKFLTAKRLTTHYLKIHGPARKTLPENFDIKKLKKVPGYKVCSTCGKENNPTWRGNLPTGEDISICLNCKERLSQPRKRSKRRYKSLDLLDRRKTYSSGFGLGKRR